MIVTVLLIGAAVQQPAKPPIASTPMDVVKTTVGSFCQIGGLGFGITAVQEATKMANVGGKARSAVPYFVVTRALMQGQRWGRVSAGASPSNRTRLLTVLYCPRECACEYPLFDPLFCTGFAGGRALGQALRGVDDSTCAMMASIFGGICAAPNLKGIPSSVATFACFGYFIESFTAKSAAGGSSDRQLADELARRAKLQKQLSECNKKIGELQRT